MVPNGQAYSSYPEFANAGSKTPPGGSTESAKYSIGMVPADTFPAEWANYLFNGATKCITRLNADTNSIKKELNSILEEYNIPNNASAYDQLLTALGKIYPSFAQCQTAAIDETKVIAVQGDVLKAGKIYVIDMTNGNTYGDGSTTYPKLSINSGTAYPLCDANGQYLASGAWAAGDTIKVIFTGAKFLMSTRAPTDAVTNGDKSPITSNAVFQIVANQFNVMRPIGSTYTQYPGQQNPNQLWGTYSTWIELDYGGAFFREDGGNALAFETSLTISSRNDTTLVFTTDHNLEVGSLLYDPTHNECRKVTAVTDTTTVVINNGFSFSDFATVIVGQNSENKEHKHTITLRGDYAGSGSFSGGYTSSAYGGKHWDTTSVTCADSGGIESRPCNFTVKVWKRTA